MKDLIEQTAANLADFDYKIRCPLYIGISSNSYFKALQKLEEARIAVADLRIIMVDLLKHLLDS